MCALHRMSHARFVASSYYKGMNICPLLSVLPALLAANVGAANLVAAPTAVAPIAKVFVVSATAPMAPSTLPLAAGAVMLNPVPAAPDVAAAAANSPAEQGPAAMDSLKAAAADASAPQTDGEGGGGRIFENPPSPYKYGPRPDGLPVGQHWRTAPESDFDQAVLDVTEGWTRVLTEVYLPMAASIGSSDQKQIFEALRRLDALGIYGFDLLNAFEAVGRNMGRFRSSLEDGSLLTKLQAHKAAHLKK